MKDEQSIFNDKVRFVEEHADEITPVTDDKEIVKEAGEGNLEPEEEERVDKVLEEFENKLFVLEKKEFAPDAKRVLITTDNPLAYNSVKALVEELENDNRCRSIAVVTGGVASKAFAAQFGSRFRQIKDNNKIFYDDLNQAFPAGAGPDVVVASLSAQNGPESVAVFSGKSILGAKKSFVIFEGWGGLGSSFSDEIKNTDAGKTAIADIDGIFCNDDLARRIVKYYLPEFPDQKIFETGTPTLDSLETDKAEFYHEEGRRKLGLADKEFALLYLSDSGGYPEFGADSKINEKTFEKTLRQVTQLAVSKPDKKFVFLLRLHPRIPECEREVFGRVVKEAILPDNLSIKLAGKEEVSMNEAIYSADVITSIVSTENMLAPKRGRPGIYLGFEEKGMGGLVLDRLYSKEILNIIGRTRGIHIADSPENLTEILGKISENPEKLEPARILKKSTDLMLEKILS